MSVSGYAEDVELATDATGWTLDQTFLEFVALGQLPAEIAGCDDWLGLGLREVSDYGPWVGELAESPDTVVSAAAAVVDPAEPDPGFTDVCPEPVDGDTAR